MIIDVRVNEIGLIELEIKLSSNEKLFVRLVPVAETLTRYTEIHVVRRLRSGKAVEVFRMRGLKYVAIWGDVEFDPSQWNRLEVEQRPCKALRNAHISFDAEGQRPPVLYNTLPDVAAWRLAA
jgi:hypothetical protein